MNDLSFKTAIKRKALSVPMRYLNSKGLLKGDVLDYGCGRGFDADTLHLDKFDPYYHNVDINKNYDTITCNYVLNTVTPEIELTIINKIKALLKPNGKAYITVRRDINKDGYTSIGTLQRTVELDLKIEKNNSAFCMYILEV